MTGERWLVATDFSAAADETLAYAWHELAPRRGSLVLFHAQGIPLDPLYSAAERLLGATWRSEPTRAALIAQMLHRVEALQRSEQARTGREVAVELALGEGHPTAAILTAALGQRATRIVLHTRRRRRRWGLGRVSVATAVVIRSPIPVLVVPR